MLDSDTFVFTMAEKSKKSGVPRELERAGNLCLAFANTGVPRRDDRRKDSQAPPAMPLEHYEELVAWSRRMDILAATDGDRLCRIAVECPRDAEAVRALAAELRVAIGRIFTDLVLGKEPRSPDLATVNGLLRLRSAVPGGDGFRLDWLGDEDALDRPLWAIAQSSVELLASEDHRKVRQCATRGCYRLFVYANRRRLWCDDALCGSRSRGKRYEEHRRRLRKELKASSPKALRERQERRDEEMRRRREEKEKLLAEPGRGRDK